MEDSGEESIEQTYFEGSFSFSLQITPPVTRYIQMFSYRIVRSCMQNGPNQNSIALHIFQYMFLNIMREKSHNTPTTLAFFFFLSAIWLCTTDTFTF